MIASNLFYCLAFPTLKRFWLLISYKTQNIIFISLLKYHSKLDIDDILFSEPLDSKDEVVKLSHIIVCLEDAMFNGDQINGKD